MEREWEIKIEIAPENANRRKALRSLRVHPLTILIAPGGWTTVIRRRKARR
jgi:hypothetical protein